MLVTLLLLTVMQKSQLIMLDSIVWMQVLRYNLGGQPLWVTDHNILQDSSAVPDCEKCGAPRNFEFQVNYIVV